MTLSVADPPQRSRSESLNERVQLSGTPWSTNCLHRE